MLKLVSEKPYPSPLGTRLLAKELWVFACLPSDWLPFCFDSYEEYRGNIRLFSKLPLSTPEAAIQPSRNTLPPVNPGKSRGLVEVKPAATRRVGMQLSDAPLFEFAPSRRI